MNSKEAKQLSLPDLMGKLGYHPERIVKSGLEYWYLSPFRQERTPSFHTSFLGGKWIWNDFGDIGGTVIDFVMRHQGYTQVKDALRFLDSIYANTVYVKSKKQRSLFSFSTALDGQQQTSASQLELLEVLPVKSRSILGYLTRQRRINREVAVEYLNVIRYRNTQSEKEYYGFGMKNLSGGVEVRSASDEFPFKSALNGRDISLIPGADERSQSVYVFEGMTDFLSLLTLMSSHDLDGDTIIMHSLSSFDRTVDKISEKDYQRINLFLDNDLAGREATQKFRQVFGQRIDDQSPAYLPHKDLNELLQARN